MLEGAFRDMPGAWDHPGLLHLHVHLMEMSPLPQRALRTGDRLRELMPECGHLMHMPTHIDIQCGHYRDVVLWNQKAIVADRKFLARAGAMNFYSVYRIHNYHFAVYGAMFLGQYAPAIAGGRRADRDHAGGDAAHSLAADGRLLRELSPDQAARAGPLRQMARDHRAGAAGGPRPLLQDDGDDALRQGRGARGTGRRAEAEAAQAAFREAKARVPETPARPQQHRPRPARRSPRRC